MYLIIYLYLHLKSISAQKPRLFTKEIKILERSRDTVLYSSLIAEQTNLLTTQTQLFCEQALKQA